MNLFPKGVSRKFARQILVTQKHSPTLLFGAGVVGVVASTVLACRATLKLEELLCETQDALNTAKTLEHDKYSDDDRKKDIAYVYVRTAVKVTRLYGPSVVLGTASISALVGSHHILSKRNAALTAAYATLQKGFDEYRQRVVDELGEDRERELRYQVKDVADGKDETGKKKTVKLATGAPSIYARFFDDSNRNWSPTSEYNILFIRCQQNYANDMLKSRGHVFLNDVYDQFGMDRTTEGAVVGWIWNGNGDNFVDFGVFDSPACESFFEFVQGRQGVWLDFNVDGVIYDKI
jgi:uncharacterized protein DUF6353